MVVVDDIQKSIDVSKEIAPDLIKQFSTLGMSGEKVFLAMIAPYVSVRLTPSKEVSASLGLYEEFGVETVIEEIKSKSKCEELHLLLNSPGGLVQSSYKVAKAIRSNFKNITVYVPHIAASGGSLVSLIGNKIVMGMMSQLTPIDPHSEDGTPALSVVRGFNNVIQNFKKISPEDAPYPLKVLADKYDAVQLDMALSNLELMKKYAKEILGLCGYNDKVVNQVAQEMIEGHHTHGDVISLESLKKMGLNAVHYTQCPKEWKIMRSWLGRYLLKSADKHIIRYHIHKPKDGKNVNKRNQRKKGK